jgi:hypothetical protein
VTLKIGIKKAAQNKRNITIFTRQFKEITRTITTIIEIEIDLCIFYKKNKNKTQDQAINTDGNLMPVIINKVIFYRNLKRVRLSYGIDEQDPYFFI